MSLHTWKIYSWCIGVKLPWGITTKTFDGFTTKFVGYGKPKAILVDARSSFDYDASAVQSVRVAFTELAKNGLRFVAFVHPFEIARTTVISELATLVTVKAFGSMAEAEQWLQSGCR